MVTNQGTTIMDTHIDTIDTETAQHTTHDGEVRWHAVAVFNGRRTSHTCMHSHKRRELAERCARRDFLPALRSMLGARLVEVGAQLVDLGDGLLEARWVDGRGRQVARRFSFEGEPLEDALAWWADIALAVALDEGRGL